MPEPINKPQLIVITGPNGAGKSTLGDQLTQLPIFDGDKVFTAQLNHQMKLARMYGNKNAEPEKIHLQIAEREMQKIFSQEIDHAITHNTSFAYEGHFSADFQERGTINKFRDAGYEVNLHFLGINLNKSKEQVYHRTQRNGFFVPEHIIEANFVNNPAFVNKYQGLFKSITLYNCQATKPLQTKLMVDKNKQPFLDKDLPQWMVERFQPLIKRVESLKKQQGNIAHKELKGFKLGK